MLALLSKLFHGTSTQHGIEDGDAVDPSHDSFGDLPVPVAWATTSREHAEYFAASASALGGDAVIFGIEVSETAVVLDARGRDFADIEEEELEGVDLLVLDGERTNSVDVAVLNRYVATFRMEN